MRLLPALLWGFRSPESASGGEGWESTSGLIKEERKRNEKDLKTVELERTFRHVSPSLYR